MHLRSKAPACVRALGSHLRLICAWLIATRKISVYRGAHSHSASLHAHVALCIHSDIQPFVSKLPRLISSCLRTACRNAQLPVAEIMIDRKESEFNSVLYLVKKKFINKAHNKITYKSGEYLLCVDGRGAETRKFRNKV